MTVLCVDDEALVLELTLSMLRELTGVTEAIGYRNGREALDWLEHNSAEIALLDIDMPGMDGITLAAKIKECSPDTAIIFLSGYTEYAVEAFRLHVSGYLLKPVSAQRLEEEIHYALSNMRRKHPQAHILVQTFGEFDLLVDGKIVPFARARAKELLAYLVDRQGASVTRPAAFAVLWEDVMYDRKMQKQLDVIIRSLRSTLEENGISEIVELKNGLMRVVPEKLDCDLYRFFDGDFEAVNAYRGEYMSAYSWASLTEAYMDRLNKRL